MIGHRAGRAEQGRLPAKHLSGRFLQLIDRLVLAVNVVADGGAVPPLVAMTTMLAMTVAVKAMDTQRWVCRIELFQFTLTSQSHDVQTILDDVQNVSHN